MNSLVSLVLSLLSFVIFIEGFIANLINVIFTIKKINF